MRKSLSTSGVALAVALTAFIGSVPANAVNEYAGITYARAAEVVAGYGGSVKLVISSREGSYLPTEQCLIVGSRNRDGKVLVDLNCNAASAQSGHPGNSLATPEGKKAKAMRDNGVQLSENYAQLTADGKTPYCARDASSAEWCVKICEESGTCSDELLQFLGM